jgi:hypothetical protein
MLIYIKITPRITLGGYLHLSSFFLGLNIEFPSGIATLFDISCDKEFKEGVIK